jgi:hypothetical protein
MPSPLYPVGEVSAGAHTTSLQKALCAVSGLTLREGLKHEGSATSNAIEALRRSNGSPGEISLLEEVQVNLMREIFGAFTSLSLSSRDWTLGFDEPRPSAKYGTSRMNDQ